MLDASCGDWDRKIIPFPGCAAPDLAEAATPPPSTYTPDPFDDGSIAWDPNRGVFLFKAGTPAHLRALDAIGPAPQWLAPQGPEPKAPARPRRRQMSALEVVIAALLGAVVGVVVVFTAAVLIGAAR